MLGKKEYVAQYSKKFKESFNVDNEIATKIAESRYLLKSKYDIDISKKDKEILYLEQRIKHIESKQYEAVFKLLELFESDNPQRLELTKKIVNNREFSVGFVNCLDTFKQFVKSALNDPFFNLNDNIIKPKNND